MIKEIDIEIVKLIHQLMAEQTGGSVGIRDEKLLDSALKGIHATFDGKDLYPTKEEKAARLGFNLISNHSFIDGNKRMGMHIMILFLESNGIHLNYSQEELAEIGLNIATGKSKYEDLYNWIIKHKI